LGTNRLATHVSSIVLMHVCTVAQTIDAGAIISAIPWALLGDSTVFLWVLCVD